MTRTKFIVTAVLAVWIAGGVQGTVAVSMAGSAFTPNLLLAVLAVLSLWTDRPGAVWLGFAVGAIEGALGGTRLWAFVVARIVGALLASSAGEWSPERGPIAAAVVSGATALISNLLLVFLLAPRGIAERLAASLGGAITTAVVGALLGWIVSRVAGRSSGSL